MLPQRGQPCQKQPSTNTTIRLLPNVKSGLPSKPAWRLQPVIPAFRNSATSRNSVLRFPFARILDITQDRVSIEKTSTIDCCANYATCFGSLTQTFSLDLS